MPNFSNTVETVHRLKQEIDKLTKEHDKALRTAVYVAMTPDGTNEYDERREKIAELINKLSLLERAQ